MPLSVRESEKLPASDVMKPEKKAEEEEKEEAVRARKVVGSEPARRGSQEGEGWRSTSNAAVCM